MAKTIKFKSEDDSALSVEKRKVQIVTTKQVEVTDVEEITVFELDLKITGAQNRLVAIDSEKQRLQNSITEWEAKKADILKELK